MAKAKNKEVEAEQEIPRIPDIWDTLAKAPELDATEKKLRNLFVAEYLIDYDAYAAVLRMGYAQPYAYEYAQRFMGEPYVQQQIKKKEVAAGNANSVEGNKKRIMAMLFREANYRGTNSSHSARVGAISKLASIHGMDAPIKTETEVSVRGGIRIYIPDNGRDGVSAEPETPSA